MYGYQALRRLAYEAGAAQQRAGVIPGLMSVWGGGNNAKERLAQGALNNEPSEEEKLAKLMLQQQFDQEADRHRFEQQKKMAEFTGQDAGSKLERQNRQHQSQLDRAQAQIDAANERAGESVEQRKLEREERKRQFDERMTGVEEKAAESRRGIEDKFWRGLQGQDITKQKVQDLAREMGPFGEAWAEANSTFVPDNPNDPAAHRYETSPQRNERRSNEASAEFQKRLAQQKTLAETRDAAAAERLRVSEEKSAQQAAQFKQNQARLEEQSAAAAKQHRADKEEYEYRILTDPQKNFYPGSPGARVKNESDADYEIRMRAEAKKRAGSGGAGGGGTPGGQGGEDPFVGPVPSVYERTKAELPSILAGRYNPISALTPKPVDEEDPSAAQVGEKSIMRDQEAMSKPPRLSPLQRLSEVRRGNDLAKDARVLGRNKIGVDQTESSKPTETMFAILKRRPFAERMSLLKDLRNNPDTAKRRGIDLAALTDLVLRS